MKFPISDFFSKYPGGIYLFKVNNRNTRTTRCEIYSKLTVKTPERRRWNYNEIIITLIKAR